MGCGDVGTGGFPDTAIHIICAPEVLAHHAVRGPAAKATGREEQVEMVSSHQPPSNCL